ncbi:MAG: PKD domain-containing protein, partial [Caldilineaceae bacterium]
MPRHKPINSRRWPLYGILVGLLLLIPASVVALTGGQVSEEPGVDSPHLFLPLIGNVQFLPPNFAPDANTTIGSGNHQIASLVVPAGVTVDAKGPVMLHVTGDARVDGTLLADCADLTLLVDGTLTITGKVDNRCTGADDSVTDLTIASRGTLVLGTAQQPADLQTSGTLLVTNDPDTPAWEYDLLPEQRSATPLPPVCAIEADAAQTSASPDEAGLITFNAQGIDPDGGPVNFAWDFGDGSPVVGGSEVTHGFATPNKYTVTLTATDDEQTTCTATAAIVIDGAAPGSQRPALWMTPDVLAVAAGTPLNFTADLSDDQATPLTHTWSFGDGAVSSSITPTHTYPDAGRYAISLTVTDEQGNMSAAAASVYVYDPPVRAAALAAPSGFCPPAAPPPGAIISGGLPNPPPPAGNNGRHGVDRIFRVRGHLILTGNIRGGDGEDG